MNKGFTKKATAMLLTLVLLFAGLGYVSTGKATAKARGVALLQEWYEAYRAGDTEESNFKGVDGIVRTTGTRYLGSCFWVAVGRNGSKLKTESASIGYRAYKVYNGNRANGFVTCGHSLNRSIDHNVYGSAGGSGRFGRIEENVLNSTCDASFVSVLSNVSTISNKTHGRGGSKATITASVVTVSKGNTVYMCGATSGVLSGQVASTNDTEIFDNDTYASKGLIRAAFYCGAGDSGAPVYMSSGGKYKIVGIIKGVGSYGSYIVKAGTINSKLGTKPY